MKTIRLLLTLLLFAPRSSIAIDATLDGRITDSTTTAGIEGATITIEPVTPGASLAAATNPFGFYRKGPIPPAAYTLKVRHGAYVDHDEAFTPASGAKVTRNIALSPRYPGVTTFDIFAQTFCTRTMMELGNVPIRVQRFLSENAAVVDETFYLTTDAKGGAILRGVRPGWFTFRFNDPADGTQRPKWDALDKPQRRYLDTAHAAVAQLMPQGQTYNFRVIGLDARDPDIGPVPLDKVYAELTGVRYNLPDDFNFGADDPEPYEIVALPTRTGETGPGGTPTPGNGSGRVREGATAGFTDLPALSFPYRYKLKLKRFGYHDKTFYFSADAAGDLTPVNPDINLDFVLETNIWIYVVSDEYAALNVLGGAKVRLQGIAGTATEGIDHEVTTDMIPGDAGYPLGVHRATFGVVLPGRYRVSVDSLTIPPPKPALDGAPYELRFRFRGSDTIDVNVGALTKHELKVKVEPATIRGRLFAADERAAINIGAAEIQDPFSAYRGPLYGPKVQTGITFSESAFAGQLMPGLKVVSFDTDDAGRFIAKVRPGYYGFKIPTMADYWGSNFDWVNAATGEQFHKGWCYDIDPIVLPGGMPSTAYHNLGVPVRSGDDINLDLYVRKQRYYVRGTVGGDTDNPVVNAWVMANPTELTIQSLPFSELANSGTVTLDAVTQPLDQRSDFGFTGTRAPGTGAGYSFEPVGPGSHSLSFTQASHTFTHMFGGPPPRSFTMPDLLYPGGSLVATDIPLEYIGNSALGNPWTSTYTGTDTVKFKFYDNNDVFVSEKSYPEYFRVSDLGSRLFFKSGGAQFKMRSGTWTLFVTDGVKWYERSVPSTNTGTEHVFDIFTRTAADVARPTQSYTLKVKAFADGDPTHSIGGATVTFEGGASAVTSASGTVDLPGQTGGYVPLTVTHPVWAWVGSSAYDASYAFLAGVPEITITVRLTRGMLVKGTVSALRLPPSVDSDPVPDAEVVISNRFGSRLATLTTDAAGKFGETPVYALPFAEAGFIDINHPGHYPQRFRFETNDTGAPGSPVTITQAVTLTPFAPPVISVKSINRLGPFLPGVRKSGSAGTLGDDPDLLGTFTVTAVANPIAITLPKYDLSNGASGGTEMFTLSDSIEEILLVDPRSYPVNPMTDTATDEPPPLTIDARFYDSMRAYMRSVGGVSGSPAKPNMFVSRASTYVPGLGAGELIGTGEVPVWKLPPGAFKPYAIVRTRNGAWNYARIEFTGFDDYKQLYGLKLPPWAAGLADIVGTVSAAESLTPDAAKEQITKIMPEGLMKALPKISGTIETDGAGFFTYRYSIANELEDGMDLPGTGWLALLPGFEGFSVEGGAILKLEGHDGTNPQGRISLNAGASGSLELKPDVEDFIPKSFPKAARKALAEKVDAKFTIFGSVDVNGHTTFTPGGPLEVSATLDTFGSITGNLEFDVTEFIEKVPHVGQVVTALNAIDKDNVVVTATLDLMTGVQHQLGFSTEFPRNLEFPSGGSIALPAGDDSYHTLRRSYLGTKFNPLAGKTTSWLETNFYLYAAVGLGFDIGGFAGAKGELRLTGQERYFPRAPEPVPSMKITMNAFGDWPLLKRIEGSLNAFVTAYLDVWVTKLEKSWEWELITIDHQFNSAPFFDLVKINISNTTRTVAGGTPATFTGLAPAPIRGLYALSNYATTSAAGDLLAFVDIAPGTGAMLLKVAKRTGPLTWGAPVTVATTTGAVLRPQMVTLPGGGAMLVWTEIAPGDTGDATPPSILKYSTTADGVAWSPPGTVASLSGVAADSRLFTLPAGKVGLVFIESDAGPGTETYDVKAVPFIAGAWGVVATVLDDTVLRAFDATGPGAAGTTPAQIAYVDSASALKVIAWDGTVALPPVTIATTDAAAPLVLTSGPDDTFVLANGFTTGAGLGLSKLVGPGPWTSLSTLVAVTPAHATVLATTVGATTRYVAAWSGGAAPATLNYAWFDGSGATLLGPFDLTKTVKGAYRSLRALPRSGTHEATLFAQFDNGTGTLELRSFDVSLTDGAINRDRDGDTLDDRAELRIVDHNTTDAIVSIDDVLAGADFDSDGYSNGTELAAGTDPAVAGSFPGQTVGASAVLGECHEFGTVRGRIVIFRTGNANVPLTVHYTMGGSATNGTDYKTLAGTFTLPVGVYSGELEIAPTGDTVAEGSETAMLSIAPDAAYAVSATSPSATVTIKDLPMDEWRFANFTTAELLDAAISGDLADAEGDGHFNLIEYAFDLPPKAGDAGAAVPVALVHPSTSALHLGLIYVRRKEALDVVFEHEITDGLLTWRAGGADVQTVSIADNLDGTETVVLRDTTPFTSNPKRFLRVKVRRYSP